MSVSWFVRKLSSKLKNQHGSHKNECKMATIAKWLQSPIGDWNLEG